MTPTLAAGAPAQPASAAAASGPRAARRRAPLAGLCGFILLAATVEIVLDAARLHSPLVPRSPQIAGWLGSLGGERLGYRVFLIAILAAGVAYGVLLALVHARTACPSSRSRRLMVVM